MRPSRAMLLSSLGSLLGQRFQRERVKEDVDTAVKWACEAVSTTRETHPGLAKRMNNLGPLLREQSKGQVVQDKNQLKEAIDFT